MAATPLAIARRPGRSSSFPDLLSNDEDFDVTSRAQPASAVCTLANGKGKTGAFNVTSVVVTCMTNTYDLGGTISGLATPTGLVLVNGADRVSSQGRRDHASRSAKVADGAPYGVTILTQPAGRTCTVQNGVGTMGASAVTNVQVNCV